MTQCVSVLKEEEEKALADSDVAPHRNDSAIRWPRSHRQTAKLWNFATQYFTVQRNCTHFVRDLPIT